MYICYNIRYLLLILIVYNGDYTLSSLNNQKLVSLNSNGINPTKLTKYIFRKRIFSVGRSWRLI